MASLQRMSDATQSVYECLLRLQNTLKEEDPLFGDVQTVQVLTNEHRVCVTSNIPNSLLCIHGVSKQVWHQTTDGNFNSSCLIPVILGTNISERICYQMVIYFSPHLFNVHSLPWETLRI